MPTTILGEGFFPFAEKGSKKNKHEWKCNQIISQSDLCSEKEVEINCEEYYWSDQVLFLVQETRFLAPNKVINNRPQ